MSDRRHGTRPRRRPFAADRLLGWAAGLHEPVLDRLPAERLRATALGGVVLGTACLSALEMYLMLHSINDGFPLIALVVVPAWFGFILSFDRLLMTKMSGVQWASRLKVTLPRVGLAVLFGLVLAEPLLLTVFHTAIEERIRTDRAATISTADASYQRCNALDANNRRQGQSDPACAGYLVSVAADVAGPTDELIRTKQNLTNLQRTFTTAQDGYFKMTERTRRECNGVEGADVTGLAGVGPECRNFREQADAFRTTNQIEAKGLEIQGLQARIPVLEAKVSTALTAYSTQVAAQTTTQMTALRDAQREIGLLERMRTFDELKEGNGYLIAATWLLRLFLTAIECAPVLVKAFGDPTPYDKVLDATLDGEREVALTRLKRTELDSTYGDRLAIEERQQDLKDEQQKLRRRDRSRDLRSDLDVEQAIADRREQLIARKASA